MGIGVVEAAAVPARDFRYKRRLLSTCDVARPHMFDHADDVARCEYLVRVRWKKTVPRARAYFKPKSGLFTSQLVRASLSRQPKTLAYLERAFDLRFSDLVRGT